MRDERHIGSWALLATLLAGASVAACADIRPFGCSDDTQCDTQADGVCMDPGFCAFPDDACDTGYRYDASATGSLAQQCVEQFAASSSTGATKASTTDSTTSGDASSSDTLAVVGSSSGDDATDTSDDGTPIGTTGGPCGDIPCPCTDAIASGQTHTCALRSDASVVCWGQNDFGKLGSGDDQPAFDDLPTVVAAGVDFTAIAASRHHSCGIAGDGATWCWGRNNLAQSAPPLAGTSIVPGVDSGATKSATAVIAGLQATCTDDGSGTLTCWGSNGNGQLASQGSAPGPLTSGPHTEGAPVLSMAAGQQHACLATASDVMCWGRNNYGQNGSGEMGGNRFTPTPVDLDVGRGGAVAVAAGRFHSCAATDGGKAVLCWGRNSCGQVSEGFESCGGNQIEYEPTPVDVPGTVVQLTGRYDHTCALNDLGDAYCWGDKKGYWIGTDVNNGVTLTPPSRVVVLDEIEEPIVDLAVGWEHSCGRAASGRLWCWGSDQYEQLGFNDPPDGMRTVEMDLLCP